MKLKSLTLAIADDHTLFRKGVIEILRTYDEITIIADAVNGVDLLEKIENNLPDIVMLDLEMPEMDGIATARYIMSKYSDIRILIMSMYGEESLVETLLDEGVHGYLLKSAEPDELRNALQTLFEGKSYFPHSGKKTFSVRYI
ncbi:response regulator transcription factor [Pontibacter silvestris]|uniref:Response regulator transcription factor n=1 Tax=Pontibacter silvestris TaxID=2305183 RepID=A0ABW4X1E6_9BACT|nr:response regulator transcription factor [Pontibacter silvestris]MCC9135450.1 response regulator transcription factor [Pontibacter silvestris]